MHLPYLSLQVAPTQKNGLPQRSPQKENTPKNSAFFLPSQKPMTQDTVLFGKTKKVIKPGKPGIKALKLHPKLLKTLVYRHPFESEVALAPGTYKKDTVIPTAGNAVSQLIGEGILHKNPVSVRDSLGKETKYTLEKDGFEFRYLPNDSLPILEKITSLSRHNTPQASQIRESLRDLMAQRMTLLARYAWGYPDNVVAIPLDAVYRNTTRQSGNAFQSVGMIHADFTTPREALNSFPDTWGPRFKKALPNQKYDDLKVERMVNVWIPLDERLDADPLVVFKKDSIPLERYTAVRRDGSQFKAQVGVSDKPLKAKYLSSLGGDKCVIFDGTQDPHTSVEKPEQGLQGRRSIELRFALVQKD